MMSIFHSLGAKGRWQTGRERNLLDGGAPFYRCYETADGESISVGALEPQFFAKLVERAGLPAADCDTRDAPSNWADLHQRYESVFKARTRDEWVEIFNDSDACVAPVLSLDEVEAHPQNQARGTFYREAGVMQAAPAPRFDRTPAATPHPPIAPGSSTDAVLDELGFSAAQIASMRDDGVLV
jgi:alpha-methylacyl-CoA racemase